ncbi:MAG TPA: hypothetical protein VKU87_04220, partial [Thermomicrobiaceae bacterium]|nr:hypothetical protein [Thermomicrobiaceae bacterium]
MRRRTVRGDTDSPEQYGDCDAVLCRDVTFSQDGRSVTVRRGTRLSEAVRQLPAAIAERRRIRFEVLEPGPDDLGQAEASRQVAAALTGSGIELDGPHQGQMNLRAARTGLLRIDPVKVVRLNRSGAVLIASALDGRVIEAGETAAVVKAPQLF